MNKSEEEEKDLIDGQRSRLPPTISPFISSNFTFDTSLLIDLKPLQRVNAVGVSEGNFSSLQVATYSITQKFIAVKTLDTSSTILKTYALAELAILKYLQHPHVITYFGAYLPYSQTLNNTSNVFLVTEFMDRGDVKRALHPDLPFFGKKIHASDLDFVWRQRLRVVKGLASALQQLQALNIVHRDIKSENLFLSGRGRKTTVKLGDFGFARYLEPNVERTYTICGTEELMAPEMLLCLPYTKSVDIFSFGLIIVELCCGTSPTPLTSSEAVVSTTESSRQIKPLLDKDGEAIRFLERNGRNYFEIDYGEVERNALAGCPYSLLELGKQCVSYEGAERPNADDIVEWISSLEEDLANKVAERVPNEAPPKKWVFDTKTQTFVPPTNNFRQSFSNNMSNSHENGNSANGKLSKTNGNITSFADLLEVRSSDANSEFSRISNASKLSNVSNDLSKAASKMSKISKHSNTKQPANVARRQIRHMARTVSSRMAANNVNIKNPSEKKKQRAKEMDL